MLVTKIMRALLAMKIANRNGTIDRESLKRGYEGYISYEAIKMRGLQDIYSYSPAMDILLSGFKGRQPTNGTVL